MAALIVAMVRFGRVEGQGVRLMRLWDTRPPSRLAEHDLEGTVLELAGESARAFTIDWNALQATCPQEARPVSWTPAARRGEEVIVVRFDTNDCRACPVREQCTTTKRSGRVLTRKPRLLHETLANARASQDTRTWQHKYRIRAGA